MKAGAREVARRVLGRVERGSYTTLALAGELSRARLSDEDRALATELAYGALKMRARLDRALSSHAPRGIERLDAQVLNALRIASYQILFLRVPAHAAVDDAVEAIKRVRGAKLAGFANALLRKLASAGEPSLPDEGAERLAVEQSAPRWLADEALARFGDGARDFLASLNVPPPVWLRANTLRATREQLIARLAAERPRAILSPSVRAPEAVAARHGGDVSSTGAFAEGWCTAQDLGAQLVAHLVAPVAGERILDACAGVGGKATHLAALAGDRAAVDAADSSERKLELLADTARRLGVASVKAIAADLTDEKAPLALYYDRVLLDAPCSGLGVLRRHPEAKWRPRPDVAQLASLQARLLDALAPRVRPGGLLVYAVCTFSDEEGPLQARAFVERHRDFAVDGEPLRTWPHVDDADAFFAVRLRRG